MKMKTSAVLPLLFALLAGCATPYTEAPLATNFPTSKQNKLQAAAHWNVIAQDAARQLAMNLTGRKTPIYVNQKSKASAFEHAFYNQFVSALVAEGVTVQKNAQAEMKVDIDLQAIRFAPDRPQYRYSGAATALTAGVWALHDATAAGGATAAIIAADAFFWFQSEFSTGATPQTEIVLTVSLGTSDAYVSRITNVYYVADADANLYQFKEALPVKTLRVKGD